MAHVTSQTKLSELKARVRSASKRNQNGAARLVRSVQQSLRVEGYDVREEVLHSALDAPLLDVRGQAWLVSDNARNQR
jgi:hypothetical protein